MSTELAVVQPQPVAPATLFKATNPKELMAEAMVVASELATVIDKAQLYTVISNRKHVRVEGWTLLGTMLGVFPVCTWTRKTEDGTGWEARVEARTLSDQIVGAAEAQCTRSEPTWKTRDDYALRSMAQTRATSKAMRLPLGYVMALGGYDATPAEEMDGETHRSAPTASAAPTRPTAPSTPPQTVGRCEEHGTSWLKSRMVPNGLYHYIGNTKKLHEMTLPAEVKAEDGKVIDVTPGCTHKRDLKYDQYGVMVCGDCGVREPLLETGAIDPEQLPFSDEPAKVRR